MLILSDGSVLDVSAVPAEVRAPVAPPPAAAAADLEQPLSEIERRHILAVLAHAGGNKTRAAAILGITTRTLYNKLAEYGLSPAGPTEISS